MIKSVWYHKVEDFSKWKEAFDNFSETRKKAGELSYSISTFAEDSKTVCVINEWSSIKNYESFLENPALADAMKAAGVLEPPHILLLNEVEKG